MRRPSVTGILPFITTLFLFVTTSPTVAQLSFSNPLLDFDSILCVARGYGGFEQHLCDQYFGCFAAPGGSIYIISGFKGNNRRVTDLLENSTVENGRYAGRRLAGGSFISPDLSYDGKEVLFAWKEGNTNYSASWDQNECFHIFKVNIDGTNLVQLTDGRFNDFDPCWLPSGRIVFISERRGGYGRCHLRPVPTYTLFSMKEDGSDIIPLSYHETNEWQPSVDNNGMIVYSRWDYVDRDDCIAHHPWICYPDGRDPRSWHGNYPLPLTTMEGFNWPDGRNLRPWAEVNVRAIPGTSSKYVATATGHHTQSFGDLIIVDQGIRDDGKMSQITGITTRKTNWGDAAGPWATAWPLSEDYYLASYEGDIVMIDKSGNRLMVCPRSATPAGNLNGFKLLDPIPVKVQKKPPDIAVQTYEGEREQLEHEPARISLANVYETDLPFPEGTVIKWLRVIQLIPKTTININQPQVCAGSESVVRMALGIVPVEEDGSAHFEAPVDRCLMFQALDENYMAVQSMRSLTYVHKGENLSCIGCHEDKWKAPAMTTQSALKRAPSKLKPEFMEALPVSYYRTVKPVFDAKCVSCHTQERKGPDMSYNSLKPYIFHFCDGGWPYTNGNINVPEVGGSRTIPGKFGAKRSKLYPYCLPSHHDVSLTEDELHRIVLWLDCNSNELGSETDLTAQRRGELVWPTIDVDPDNPLGLEDPTSSDAPSSANVLPAAAMVKPDSSVRFSAVAVDLMKRKVDPQPSFTWSVSGGGTISDDGLFTAGSGTGGPYTVTATTEIDGERQEYTAIVTVSLLTGEPLPAGKLTTLLCLRNSSSSSTCMSSGDESGVENNYIGGDAKAPKPGETVRINGSDFEWAAVTNQGGTWFADCGDNRTSYAAITLVNSRPRTFRIEYVQDDEVTIWMNGDRVLSDMDWHTEPRLSGNISMPAGNVGFIIKHTNNAGNGGLSLRFTDENGDDINDLLYNFSPVEEVALRKPVAVTNGVSLTPYTIRLARGALAIDGACSRDYRVEVFNSRGQRMARFAGIGDLHYLLPMESLPAGMFVVRIEIDGKTYSKPLALTGAR